MVADDLFDAIMEFFRNLFGGFGGVGGGSRQRHLPKKVKEWRKNKKKKLKQDEKDEIERIKDNRVRIDLFTTGVKDEIVQLKEEKKVLEKIRKRLKKEGNLAAALEIAKKIQGIDEQIGQMNEHVKALKFKKDFLGEHEKGTKEFNKALKGFDISLESTYGLLSTIIVADGIMRVLRDFFASAGSKKTMPVLMTTEFDEGRSFVLARIQKIRENMKSVDVRNVSLDALKAEVGTLDTSVVDISRSYLHEMRFLRIQVSNVLDSFFKPGLGAGVSASSGNFYDYLSGLGLNWTGATRYNTDLTGIRSSLNKEISKLEAFQKSKSAEAVVSLKGIKGTFDELKAKNGELSKKLEKVEEHFDNFKKIFSGKHNTMEDFLRELDGEIRGLNESMGKIIGGFPRDEWRAFATGLVRIDDIKKANDKRESAYNNFINQNYDSIIKILSGLIGMFPRPPVNESEEKKRILEKKLGMIERMKKAREAFIEKKGARPSADFGEAAKLGARREFLDSVISLDEKAYRQFYGFYDEFRGHCLEVQKEWGKAAKRFAGLKALRKVKPAKLSKLPRFEGIKKGGKLKEPRFPEVEKAVKVERLKRKYRRPIRATAPIAPGPVPSAPVAVGAPPSPLPAPGAQPRFAVRTKPSNTLPRAEKKFTLEIINGNDRRRSFLIQITEWSKNYKIIWNFYDSNDLGRFVPVEKNFKRGGWLEKKPGLFKRNVLRINGVEKGETFRVMFTIGREQGFSSAKITLNIIDAARIRFKKEASLNII